MTLPGSDYRSRQSPSTEVQTHALQADCPGSASSPPGASPCPLAPPSPTAKVSPLPVSKGPAQPIHPLSWLLCPGPCLPSSHPGTQSCSACGLLSPAPALCTVASLLHHPLHPAPRAQACHGLPFCLVTLDLRVGPPLRGLPGPSQVSPAPGAPGALGFLSTCTQSSRRRWGADGGSSCAQGARLGRVTSFCRGCDELPPAQWPITTQVLLIIPGVQEPAQVPRH